jgi:hypothetical protein
MARHSEQSGEGERELRYPAIAVRGEVIGGLVDRVTHCNRRAESVRFPDCGFSSISSALSARSFAATKISRICWTIFGFESRDRSHLIGID